MKKISSYAVFAFVAILILSAASCGANTTPTDNTPNNTIVNNTVNPTPSVGNSQTKTVTLQNFSFNPQNLTVAVGTTVVFKNNDSVTHTVTFDQGASNGGLAPGSSFSRTFTAKGTFNYHCSIHPSMTGQIIVQ